MNGWIFRYEGFNPEEEGRREALCTLGNGYFATRGAAAEAHADGVHYPGTYLAGGYDRLETEIAGRRVENEDLVNLPNWLPLNFRPKGGAWLDLRRVKLLDYTQELDLHQGLLLRSLRFEDGEGRRTELRERRLVHACQRHFAAQEMVLKAENWSGPAELLSGLDARVTNSGVERYGKLEGRHLEPLEARAEDSETLFLKARTRQSRLEVAQACRTRIWQGGERLRPAPELDREPGYAAHRFPLHLAQGEEVRVEKAVTLFTSRDQAISEPGLEARKWVALIPGFGELLESHALGWRHLWERFDIGFEEDDGDGERNLLILRLHIFHLLQTVSMHSMDLDVGVPARGWHGEAYRGHVFWDELFIFPLLNLRVPEITRTLLRYRYRRLAEARLAATEAGLRGAMFPWQSGSNGREESQEVHLNPESGRWIPDRTRLQRHVNAAIAYNVWQYFQVTCDTEFLAYAGAEMMLEIARFWSSLATWNEERRRFEILGVMGPDEYHDGYPQNERLGLDNNAYTNLMAVYVLCRALDVLEALPVDRRRELCQDLHLEKEEIERWEEISRRMFVPFHDGGIISQFEGYERLEELDWESYRRRHGQVMRLDRILEAEGESPNRYKASKQADVLMLFYLFSAEELEELFGRLGYDFDPETIPRNIDYYLQRTSHGSTLSQVVHSWVLARSDRERSWSLFCQALLSDVGDIQGGTTAEGIHLGAMAGTVDLIQRGYTGIAAVGDCLRFNPCLPEAVTRIELRVRYRSQNLGLVLTPKRLQVACQECDAEPIRLLVGDREQLLRGGESAEFEL